MPGLQSSPASRTAALVSLRGPGQHAVVLLHQFHRLMERACPGIQEPEPGPEWEEGVRGMGSVHVPRLAWPRRGAAALAVAVLAALTAVNGAPHAYAATEGPYGGTPAAVPGTVQAANYDTGGQGVAYNVTSANGSANSYRSDGAAP